MEAIADDNEDQRVRTGTVWSATAHAVTAVIGSGVLAVPWSVAQMGWAFGPISLLCFAVITYVTARLLSDCYRSPDPVKGQRNHNYIGAVRAILGDKHALVCVITQYSQLWGTMVGYTITAAMSMMSIKRTNCYHTRGGGGGGGGDDGPNEAAKHCDAQSSNTFMLVFGAVQVVLSQFPSLGDISFLSVIAATMSFGYSFVALFLCVRRFASSSLHHHELMLRGTLTGVEVGKNGITPAHKVWNTFQALGNIAFSYTYSQLLVEIQDTLKSPPAENKTMKRATLYSIAITTAFYFSLGCMGYLSFGNHTPGNVLTAFHDPFWLVDAANFGVIIHLTAAFQVFGQPIYACYENLLATTWPSSPFIHKTYTLPIIILPRSRLIRHKFTMCRLILRPIVVAVTILTAMMFPFFNAVLGLLGAIAFCPLTVYFPVAMYKAQAQLKILGFKWFLLQALCFLSLVVSLVCATGSIADMAQRFRHAKLFTTTP